MNESSSEVRPEERISRYILNGRYFKEEAGEIKAEAFLPTKPKPELQERQTSVYRTSDLEETNIWSIGDQHVANPEAKRFILARGDLPAKNVFSQDLRIVPLPFPHPRHANIVNWPNEESNEHRKAIAILLAKEARLIVK